MTRVGGVRCTTVGALALVAGLAACTGGDAATPATTSTESATSTTTTVTSTSTTTTSNTTTPTTITPTTTTPTTTATTITSVVPSSLPPREPLAATGAGVTVVVFDRGVDWRHPDLRNPDGSTRLTALVDLTEQRSGCAPDRPEPAVHLPSAIDAALDDAGDDGVDDGTTIPLDGSGEGTALAGLAVGNGRAADGELTGYAPAADLVVVDLASDGTDGSTPSTGCIDDALDVVDLLLEGADGPAVALFGTGTQWGPIDGSSAASRRIAESFGPDRPGRVMVTSAGDEGDLPNHASVEIAAGDVVEIPFERPDGVPSNPTLWYSGDLRAQVSIRFGDDGDEAAQVFGPLGPGESELADGVAVIQYEPGREFHPWTSTSGDRAVWISIDRPAGAGAIVVEVLDDGSSGDAEAATGRLDVYGDVAGASRRTSSIVFTDHLADGRLTDVAATEGAVVATAHVARTSWVDRLGRLVDQSPAAGLGARWPGAASGPTRDGRPAVTVAAPGHHAIAPLAGGSLLAARDELVPDMEALGVPDATGSYVVASGTAPAAAIVAGTVAAMLEVDPGLTGAEVAELLQSTAVADESTGEVPNPRWGAGKLDARAAITAANP
ncbi:MAG: S8 family serine peptidase [Ilumatobacteraceae bacterium]